MRSIGNVMEEKEEGGYMRVGQCEDTVR